MGWDPEGPGATAQEAAELYERLNMVEDLLGDALAYLENPAGYASSAGIMKQLQDYFEFAKSGRPALTNQQETSNDSR